MAATLDELNEKIAKLTNAIQEKSAAGQDPKTSL